MRPSGLKENLKKVFWKKNGASTRTEKGNVLPEMAPKPMDSQAAQQKTSLN